jgi:5-methylcytosine-specific restriction endonuclease McrA
MSKSRASKGLLLPPRTECIPAADTREKWLEKAVQGFVAPGEALKKIYGVILHELWPVGHGIPGPQVSEQGIRKVIDEARKAEGQSPYVDPFRRMRELQGDEGFTCIIKEGSKYQLVNLNVGVKREPRAKPSPKLWNSMKAKVDYKCAHCGQSEPSIKLSPDHRTPRSRGGGNEDSNWQPLCEQCNNAKSSACQGCALNCSVCFWAYPEIYKPIVVEDDNREQIRRAAEKASMSQTEFANKILRQFFLKK